MAKGFTQTYGIDYLETFAPVAKLNSIPYESFCQLQLTDLHQLDVKKAFLFLSSWRPPRIGIGMSPPPGFRAQGEEGKVCR